MTSIIWLAVCVLIVCAGLAAGRGISAKQWTGGDRSLGPVGVGCILAATQIGGMSIVGAAQNGYTLGIAASWYSIGNGVFLLVFALLAKTMREKMPSETIPDYLESRFSKRSANLYSYAWLVMGFIYIPIQLKTIAGIIQTVIPALNSEIAIVLGLTLAAVYTSVAGMKGSSVIGKITCFGTYILLVAFIMVTLKDFGGYSGLVSTLPAAHSSLSNGYSVSTIVSYMLGGTLSAIVMQSFMQSYLAAKDVKTARNGSIIGYLLAAPISVLAAIIGMIAASSNDGLGDGATAFAWAVGNFSSPLVSGLILAFATMIIVATVAGMILANGTIMSRIYRTQINPNADEKKVLKTTRVATIIFAYLTLIAAFAIPSASLTDMFLTLVYSCTIPTSFSVIAGLFWNKANSTASLASMVCGLMTGIVWQVFGLAYIMSAVYAIALVTFAVGIVVTLATSGKEMSKA